MMEETERVPVAIHIGQSKDEKEEMVEKQVLQLVYHSTDVGWRNGYWGGGHYV